jgi:hypothetical protein
MAALWSGLFGGLSFLAAALPRGAGPADPFKDFGPAYGIVIALDVINLAFVLVYLIRILAEKPPSTRPVHRG